MTDVYLGLGSNVTPKVMLERALTALEQSPHWHLCAVSPWYQSPALGFSGNDFINLVVKIDTTLELDELLAKVRELEWDFGRPLNAKKWAPRSLDIDVLLYGQRVCQLTVPSHQGGVEIPRPELYERSFVLKPLLDIAPNLCCPRTDTPLSDWLPALSSQPLTRLPNMS